MSGQGREEQDDLDKVFKALGHITRRRILRLLAQNPRYPYEISKMLGLTSRVILNPCYRAAARTNGLDINDGH